MSLTESSLCIEPGRINPARFDLVSLKLVLHLEQAGSIAAAAEQCHLSLMNASARLRRLEDALGRRLFTRHRRGVEPTPAGRAVARAGAEVLNTVNMMALEVSLAREAASTLKENPGRRGRAS